MHLLHVNDDGVISLIELRPSNIPQYAILSHTWGSSDDEVTFQDMMNGMGKSKAGYHKIRFCADQTAKDGLLHRQIKPHRTFRGRQFHVPVVS